MFTIIDYVWIGGRNELRSKSKVIYANVKKLADIPNWNYDGSSCYDQAPVDNSEIIIQPKKIFKCPFKKNGIIVMCDTYNINGEPTANNFRAPAEKIFEKFSSEVPWFGLEQEYFIFDRKTNLPVGFNSDSVQGQYYCGVGSLNSFARSIVDEHLDACLVAGVKIGGTNAEVAPGQWEFQTVPLEGIDLGDHLWIARYLLERISEKYNVYINYDPKPLYGFNGSGCHVNFSTKSMRKEGGLYHINESIKKLADNYLEHVAISGLGNERRLTGQQETASYTEFTHGIGSRDTSVRIPNEVIKNKCGYAEYRIFGSNIDPYLVTSKIIESILEKDPQIKNS